MVLRIRGTMSMVHAHVNHGQSRGCHFHRWLSIRAITRLVVNVYHRSQHPAEEHRTFRTHRRLEALAFLQGYPPLPPRQVAASVKRATYTTGFIR